MKRTDLHTTPEGAVIFLTETTNGVQRLGIDYNGRLAILLPDHWLDLAWGVVRKDKGFVA